MMMAAGSASVLSELNMEVINLKQDDNREQDVGDQDIKCSGSCLLIKS